MSKITYDNIDSLYAQIDDYIDYVIWCDINGLSTRTSQIQYEREKKINSIMKDE